MSEDRGPRLQLAPPAPRARRWLFVLVALAPLAALVASTVAQYADGRAALAQGGPPALAVAALWYLLDRLLQRQRLQLDADMLDLRSTFYRCRTPLQALDLERARVVDLDEHTGLRPLLRTNGFSLPGLRSGWYRLRNGRRGFVATAGGRRVLWLPASGRYDLLVEPGDPSALLARLRELAGGRPHP